jgi:hypothetical protein
MYDDDELFANRIAAPLRAPESVDLTFKARAMAAVHAEGAMPSVVGDARLSATLPPHSAERCTPAAQPQRWWQRSITVHLTPIGALALAAGVAGMAVLGDLALRRSFLPQHLAAPGGSHMIAAAPTLSRPVVQHDTAHVVRFMLVAPSASSVALVGDFNNWSRNATHLVPTGRRGVWTVSVPFSPGRYEYAFIVDGIRWTADPHAALNVVDDFGTESSIVTVGTRVISPTI